MRRIDWLAVSALLLFAAGLRMIGLSHGQLAPSHFPSYAPYGMTHEAAPIHPDEFLSVSIPVNMLLRNRLNPGFFNYPSFIINTNYALLRLTGAADGWSLAPREDYSLRAYADFSLYVFSRMYSVFGSMLTVACAYAITRIIAGRYAAIFAGLLVTVSYTLVQHAHYIKPASLATGWMMLAVWACVASLVSRRQRERSRMVLAAAVFTGLAATTRYNAAAVAIVVLITGLIELYRNPSQRALLRLFLSWLLIPLVYALCSPYTLRDYESFWRDFSNIVAQYQVPGQVADYFLVDHWTGFAYLWLFIGIFSLGLPALIAAVFAFIAAWQERGSHFFARNTAGLLVIMISPMILAYSLVVMRTIRPGHTDHMILPILPFIAIFSGVGADWIGRKIKSPSQITLPVLTLVLIIQPLVMSVQVVEMFSQPDTRQVMLQWIHEHIPRGSSFFLNGSYNVPLDEQYYPSESQPERYRVDIPSGEAFDYMIVSDALAFDILRAPAIVPAQVIEWQREYLRHLDSMYPRLAEISRPAWTGSEAMMNMAPYWHNPTLILYCLKPALCERSA